MNLKKYFIRKTSREGIFYKIVDKMIFKFLEIKQKITHGHIFCYLKIKKYLKSNKIIKIHFGAGKKIFKNYLNSDIIGNIPINITKKLPFKNNSVDVIYSSHLIEHIYQKEFIKYLKESYRILKNNGYQIIQTPCLEKVSKILYSNSKNKDFILKEHERYSLIKPVKPAMYINDLMHICFAHKYLYDFETISFLAKKLKYSKIEKLNNYNLPDKDIQLDKYDQFWDLQTETYILYK